ncbi:plakophilin-2 isoform X1 [Etheostoma cragini]|uniref:plakophilin-2 isoform X1 n=1 Tax=Etheostoma cragini TaxID=417921 RepID=UPI00155E3188|nr:plakophilin-2 isoform X1 [Etheostoma cragini]
MEDMFFKPALPAQDSFVLHDTSLALPAEPTLRSPMGVNSYGRSLRVNQQVQLTLARKGRKAVSNGSVQLQKNTAKNFDATDGSLPNMKVKGLGFTNRSLSNNHVLRPFRRVEVSPAQSPELPRSHFDYSTHRYGMYTHPGPSQSHRGRTLLDHSLGSDSFRRYAYSEAPCITRTLVSTSADETYCRRSLRQTAAPQPVLANAAFQTSGEYGSRWGHNQTIVKQYKNTVQGQSGDMMLCAIQPQNGLSWLAQIRRDGQRHHRLNSYPPSVTSVTEVDMGLPMDVDLPVQQIHAQNSITMKSENKPPEMTLERAVNLLTQDNEEMLICATSHIQNQCFMSGNAKKMVYYLRGIGKLLHLLCNDNEEVQRVAAGALRNVVYQSSENKMEVKENEGLATILRALKSSRDVETRQQLTGLLWNLSSHDLLKEHLSKEVLSVLTKIVLVPSSGLSEGENPKDELLADADAFHNATGCLRNLSSAGPDGRKAMRECENLIDSLVYYIRGAVADKRDDKSTENCVYILHNLSYQIEAELPKRYTLDLRETRQNLAPKQKAVGCFAYRSANMTEHLERQCPLLEEKANPRGIEWLWSTITIRMYLSLMARSVRQHSQEAAIGALQNITAGKGAVSEAIAFTIVQRENGLQHVKKMLEEGESDVKRTTVSLIKNLSRYQELHPDVVMQVLPELVGMLPNDDTGTEQPTEVTASLCHTLNNLCQSDRQHVRAVVSQGALPKIINISSKDNGHGPTRAGQAACLLLHTMWKHSDLHGAYKKGGYRKADFINARTTKAVNSG